MRLSVETCVHTRPLEASLLKDRGLLFCVGIDREFAECHDELVQVRSCLTRLNGIRLGSGRIPGREKSLRGRDGRGRLIIITTAARDERNRRQSSNEWDGEAHRDRS